MTSIDNSAAPMPLPAPSRQPTVALSQDNVRRLQGFPRPPKDNGIGLHFHLDLRDEFIAGNGPASEGNPRDVDPDLRAGRAPDRAWRHARASRRASCRWYASAGTSTSRPTRCRLSKACAAPGGRPAGAAPVEPLYVQLYNEPEDPREWMGGQRPPDWARRFGEAWAARCAEDRRRRRASSASRCSTGRASTGRSMRSRPTARKTSGSKPFFVHHNYGQNHPPAYPYDAIKQQTDPGMTIIKDTTPRSRFLAHASWMQERLGFVAAADRRRGRLVARQRRGQALSEGRVAAARGVPQGDVRVAAHGRPLQRRADARLPVQHHLVDRGIVDLRRAELVGQHPFADGQAGPDASRR